MNSHFGANHFTNRNLRRRFKAMLTTCGATLSHFCLVVFLIGCAGQERTVRERPSPSQSSTNLPLALQSFTKMWGVTVTIIQKDKEDCIYVDGEVNRPARIPWTNGLTLTKAIELAGGFTSFASKSQVMLRRRANGTTEQYSFVPPVADTVKNVKLDPGDMVHVTTRGWLWPAYWRQMTTVVRLGEGTIKVEGEVIHPGLFDSTNRLTVLSAIRLCGGLTQQASHHVRVVREDGRILNVNCNKAIRDGRLDLEVFPGNAIQIPKRTNYNETGGH